MSLRLVFVPVVGVGRMAMLVVDVVDMVTVLHCLVATSGAMRMVVWLGWCVIIACTLVPVVLVLGVPVTVVEEVEMLAMAEACVAAVGTMGV